MSNMNEGSAAKIGHVLIINGGARHAFSGGALNAMLAQVAADVATETGASCELIQAFEPFDAAEEVQRFLRADLIIYQMPAWWMGTPWPMKRYIDEVFTAGYGQLYANDGRTPDDPDKRYGSGGLLAGSRYMISATWNAPEIAFTDPAELFEGGGVEPLYFAFHKANQMLGLTAFPTFVFADVVKNPKIDRDVQRYRAYLTDIFNGAVIASTSTQPITARLTRLESASPSVSPD